MFLFANDNLNMVLTLVLAVIYIVLAVYVNRIIANRRKNDVKQQVLKLYLILFFVLVIFTGLALWFFNVDVFGELNIVWNDIITGITSKLGALVGTLFIIFVSMLLIEIIRTVLNRITRRKALTKKRVTTIVKLINSLVRYTVIIIAFLIILSIWGVNVLPALAGLGILGLVIGLGAQKLIQDFIAG